MLDFLDDDPPQKNYLQQWYFLYSSSIIIIHVLSLLIEKENIYFDLRMKFTAYKQIHILTNFSNV